MKNFIASIRKNLKGISIMLVSALVTSLGVLFWKLSYTNGLKFLILGFAFYGIGAVLMIMAFRFGNLSVLHPFQSVSYLFAILFGLFILHEHINNIQFIGIIAIVAGVIMIGGGDN